MTGHGRSVAARFSAAAKSYAQHTDFQHMVASMTAPRCVEAAPDAGRILEVGCGTGWLTRELINAYPGAEIHAVDVAPGMISLCRKSFGDAVSFMESDIDAFDGGGYDLVCSSLALHWCENLEQTFGHLAGLLAPGGCLVASVMLKGTFAELHEARRQAAPGKPVTPLPDLQHFDRAMRASGLKPGNSQVRESEREIRSLRDFLREIHLAGLTGGAFSSSGVPLSRGELKALEGIYLDRFGRENGLLPVTYRFAWLRANAAV